MPVKQRQTIYIMVFPETGKTAFLASYLKRWQYEVYSVDEISAIPLPSKKRMPGQERIVVLEDLHRISSHEQQETAYSAIECLAGHPDVWLILTARCPIPAWLNQLHIRYAFRRMGEEDLFLSEKETKKLLEKFEVNPLQETMEDILRLAGGYPLAIRIAAMHLRDMDTALLGDKRREEEQRILRQSMVEFWEYLENKVYPEWDRKIYSFLMQISIVEQFDLEMAQFITKKGNAGKLLRAAQELGNFIETSYDETGNPVYVLRSNFGLP